MFLQILAGAPIWVWPLFAALIAIGYASSKARVSHAYALYLLPLLGLISLKSVIEMPKASAVWLFYVGGYAIGMAAGFVLQKRWVMRTRGPKVWLSGEWMTMAVLLMVFSANFAAGTVRVVSPSIYNGQFFPPLFALFVAIVSGTFAGRALRVFAVLNGQVARPLGHVVAP